MLHLLPKFHAIQLRKLLLLSFFMAILRISLSKKYTVLRINIDDESQLKFIRYKYLNTSTFDFWKEPTIHSEQVHVMVADNLLSGFQDELKLHGFKWQTMIEDVGKLIQIRMRESEGRRHRDLSRQFDSVLPGPGDQPRRGTAFNFGRYHSFADIINYLNALAVNFPDRVQVQPIGITHEGRQIPLIKIGTNVRKNKPGIWIDGGIHAREWVSPAAVLYFINQLITGYDTQPDIRQFVDLIDWFIVPLLNPDGYEYSRSSPDPEIRLWRKNRSPIQCTDVNIGPFAPPRRQCCQGVDLNRNFDWFFGQIGASSDPCSEIYSGTFAFSEPETRAVRDFLSQQHGRIKTFMTFHSYSQILMYPFGHALRTYPQDVTEMSTTALRAAQALQSMFGTKYTVGTGADTLYPASGGSEDWAKGRMDVKYSFLFELRPEENVYDGFLLSESQILPTARETWEAVKVIGTQTLRQFGLNSHGANVAIPTNTRTVSRRLCRDLDQLCQYWAQNGACHAWPTMRERCALSCGFCSAANPR